MAGTDLAWLLPYPDVLLGALPDDPAAVATSRAGVRLAFVAALQYLSARSRAVLIQRHVQTWSASDVGDLLDMSPTAVPSELRRGPGRPGRVGPARRPAG